MVMTPEQIRLKQNPVLTNLLLGMGQGTMIAERLFPRLPQTLSSVVLARLGDERLRRYNLRRAPGARTKRVDISYKGEVYTVDQYSVEVPIPRELIRESEEGKRMNLTANLDVSRIAMSTCNDVLGLDYEAEVAELATNPDTYADGHVVALAGGTKWSSPTGTPVTDMRAAREIIRRKVGVRPNTAMFSPDAWNAVITNHEVRSYLPASQLGPATLDQMRTILEVPNIVMGDAIIMGPNGASRDVWGNNASLSFVPTIGANGSADFSLAQPALGFTNVIDGHPFAEQPYYDSEHKSWIYGATFERRPNVAYDDAGFLFQNPA